MWTMQGESVDSGTAVPGKRKILDIFLIKFFAYFFISQTVQKLKKTLAILKVEKQKKIWAYSYFQLSRGNVFP